MCKREEELVKGNDWLYYRIHENTYYAVVRNNSARLFPGPIFKFQGEELSCDWNKYSTPYRAKHQARKPKKNGVAKFQTKLVKKENHTVRHTPEIDNRAHCSIEGSEAKVRRTLQDIASWCKGYEILKQCQ